MQGLYSMPHTANPRFWSVPLGFCIYLPLHNVCSAHVAVFVRSTVLIHMVSRFGETRELQSTYAWACVTEFALPDQVQPVSTLRVTGAKMSWAVNTWLTCTASMHSYLAGDTDWHLNVYMSCRCDNASQLNLQSFCYQSCQKGRCRSDIN